MLSDNDFYLLCNECGLENSGSVQPVKDVIDSELPVLTESELTSFLQRRSAQDSIAFNFLSAGRFNNFIPEIIKAGKLQPELCRNFPGSAYQKTDLFSKSNIEKNIKSLTGMPCCSVVNDDLTTLLTSLIIAIHVESDTSKNEALSKVLISATVSPAIRSALRTRLKYQSIDLVVLDYDKNSGRLCLPQLQQFDDSEIIAVVTAWPNYFGLLEDIAEISDWVENKGGKLIGLSDPLSLSLIKSPFSVADGKLDYLLGDLQAVGLTASQYGYSPSFLASAKELHGSINSITSSHEYTDNLSVIHSSFSLSGISALYQSARISNDSLNLLVEKLTEIGGVEKRFSSNSMNECVIEIAGLDVEKALKILSGHNFVFGYVLQDEYPELSNCLLISCSDQHTMEDIDKLVTKIATVVKNLSTAGCPVKPKFNN
ncbi:MAG: hypothetical protein GY744_17920 [Gammaproteobacteria bacterium]|nr:hypothetical protein [Gammaproteobacteria bacterium]